MVDEAARPSSILPGTQVLRTAIPSYCQNDPTPARMINEAAADLFISNVESRTVAELLAHEHRQLPVCWFSVSW
ncbi:hypothetical protein [Phytohabitans rumicis]|uniref:Uncharacterized protein n=1 Tax=Phytohabitans rumicis TaxID=1076125 RepID=A0A6V8LKM6_9ACTN|nr:hypothetical protein [Phytohabitans rumicis]GFJ93195.1 hypothetical protein Prum_068370 [Phytohabitans rumicis]